MDLGVIIALLASVIVPLTLFLAMQSPVRRELKACHDGREKDAKKIDRLEERCSELEFKVSRLEREKLLLEVDQTIRAAQRGGADLATKREPHNGGDT